MGGNYLFQTKQSWAEQGRNSIGNQSKINHKSIWTYPKRSKALTRRQFGEFRRVRYAWVQEFVSRQYLSQLKAKTVHIRMTRSDILHSLLDLSCRFALSVNPIGLEQLLPSDAALAQLTNAMEISHTTWKASHLNADLCSRYRSQAKAARQPDEKCAATKHEPRKWLQVRIV